MLAGPLGSSVYGPVIFFSSHTEGPQAQTDHRLVIIFPVCSHKRGNSSFLESEADATHDLLSSPFLFRLNWLTFLGDCVHQFEWWCSCKVLK